MQIQISHEYAESSRKVFPIPPQRFKKCDDVTRVLKNWNGGLEVCGISGAFFSTRAGKPLEEVLTSMNHVLAHRGPDDAGIYVDSRLGFGFGHTRLSILDPSAAGAQPIWSKNRSVVLTFNGEIYNHLELRAKLASEGHEVLWDGHSDSETLVELLASWGPRETLSKLVGMFAFALFEFDSQTVTIARDRAGEKPVYFGQIPGVWGFASELSALEILFGDSLTLDERGLSHYMSRSFLPEQYSIYRQVHKLPPGTFLSLKLSEIHAEKATRPVSYWSPPSPVEPQRTIATSHDRPKLNVAQLDLLLTKSVSSQLQADVPVGTFLSGGIDSTLVTAIAKKIDVNLKTFALGFESIDLDEAPFAKHVAGALGCLHSEIYLTSADMVEIATSLAGSSDEPFADSSAIPTYALSRFAKEEVSVVLTGDGGDELFGGYPRYQRVRTLTKMFAIPLLVRERVTKAMELLPPNWVGKILNPVFQIRGSFFGAGITEKKIKRYLPLARSANELNLYQGLISSRGSTMLRKPQTISQIDSQFWQPKDSVADSAALFDFLTFLPGDILYKVDRTSMAHSLETRAPLLDVNVMEFAHRLQTKEKHQAGQGKFIMRQLLEQYLPAPYWDRPKSGFSMPMAQLLRRDLKDWAWDLIGPAFPRFDFLFDYKVIQGMWKQHLASQDDFSTELWNFLMLSAWLDARSPQRAPQDCTS